MRPNHAMMCRRWRSARTSQLQMSSPTLYNARREKLLLLAYWLIPPAFCLVIYYWGLRAWYQQDDFLWLGQRFRIGTWHDSCARSLGRPLMAHPAFQRAFIPAGGQYVRHGCFSRPPLGLLDGSRNLALISSLARRISNSRVAGFVALFSGRQMERWRFRWPDLGIHAHPVRHLHSDRTPLPASIH